MAATNKQTGPRAFFTKDRGTFCSQMPLVGYLKEITSESTDLVESMLRRVKNMPWIAQVWSWILFSGSWCV